MINQKGRLPEGKPPLSNMGERADFLWRYCLNAKPARLQSIR